MPPAALRPASRPIPTFALAGNGSLKKKRASADANGVDQISAPVAAPVETASRVEEQKALAQAMIKLIETCASVGRDVLPPDATFHTYA
jgi:hypothetical protein